MKKLTLAVIAGPHAGRKFEFDRHDTFLVGRSRDAHLRLSEDDPYFSRRHFMLEINPPRCRLIDLDSRNGIRVNGKLVKSAELEDGDEIEAGHTKMRLTVIGDDSLPPTRVIPSGSGVVAATVRPLTTQDSGSVPDINVPDIPGYKVRKELGRGSMGVVYSGVRLTDKTPVAIKTIAPGPGTNRKCIDRFLREAEILSELNHTNVVHFFEVGETPDGVLFLVMELVDGPTAADLLRKGPLPVGKAVRLAIQMLNGLAHAHKSGFVHRDVKPGNLLIGKVTTTKRVAKLADFGLARVYAKSQLSGLTMQGEIGGTPAYMAPEQITHYREVLPAADQYSAAATLYSLLTGHFVYDLPTDGSDLLVHILTRPPVPVRDRIPAIPKPLAAVLHKALSREADDRYPDVAGFRDALAPFGKGA